MKAIKIIILVLLAAGIWTACEDEKVEDVLIKPELAVQNEVNCDWKGTPVAVVVNTNQKTWLASVSGEDGEWCLFVPRRDSIILKVRENPLETERRAQVIITTGGLSDTLHVIQEAGDQPYCRVSEPDLKFIWHENTLETEVITNQTSWVPQLKNAEWCSIKVTGNHIRLTAGRNNGTGPREGQLIITAGRAEPLVVPLRQEGKQSVMEGTVAFEIPQSFMVSDIYEVWNGEQKVAEICREYVPVVDDKEAIVVVYPWKNGKPGLTGLVVADGGKLDWNGGTPVYSRGSASKALATVGWNGSEFLKEVPPGTPSITVFAAQLKDIEGNFYRLVKIGSQYWIGDNLRTTKYADGSAIGVDYTSEQGAWSLFEDRINGKVDKETAGLLYNWFVLPRIAPAGWHVPASDEWETLQTYLGGNDAVLMRKAEAWGSSTNSNNLSGFSAVPGGLRWDTGAFQTGSSRDNAQWWATDEDEKDEEHKKAYYLSMSFNSTNTNLTTLNKHFSYSIRLLRD